MHEDYLIIARNNRRQPQNNYFSILREAEAVFDELKADPAIEYAELCAGTPGHWRSLKLYEKNPRLTHWNGKKWVLKQGSGMWRVITEKLAAYEELGTPEEIREALRSRGWTVPEFFAGEDKD